MIERRRVLWFAFFGAALLAGCQRNDTSSRTYFEPIRYRLTAEVDTPEGLRTGSSVIEVRMNRAITGYKLRGEAAVVDLPGGQALFVLLRSPTNADWAASLPAIPMPESDISPPSFKERQAQLERQLAVVRQDRAVHFVWGGGVLENRAGYLPYMVRFNDIGDPTSVEKLTPDNLAKSFGTGYHLRSLTVQITDAPVTQGLQKRLRWLPAMWDHDFNRDGPFNTKYPAILLGLARS